MDYSPPGSPVHGILQARTLEWIAISFSNALKWKVKVKSLSCVQLFLTSWTAAYQAPSSMGFSRQEYWSGVPLPSLVTRASDAKMRKNLAISILKKVFGWNTPVKGIRKDGWWDILCPLYDKSNVTSLRNNFLKLLTVVLKMLYHAFSLYVQVLSLQWQFTKQF